MDELDKVSAGPRSPAAGAGPVRAAGWQARFTAYLGHGWTQFSVEAADVVLAARGSPPAALLRNDVKKRTLRGWSEALLASVATERAPRWLGVACLYALKFRGEALSLAVTVKEPEDWSRYLAAHSGASRDSVLVIGSSVASPAHGWLRPSGFGAVWVRRDWLREATLLLHKPLQFASILIEAPREPKRLAAEVQFNQFLMAEARYAYFGFSPLPGGLTPSVPYIYDPVSLDDAISKLNTMVPSSHRPSGIPTEKK